MSCYSWEASQTLHDSILIAVTYGVSKDESYFAQYSDRTISMMKLFALGVGLIIEFQGVYTAGNQR